MDPLTFALGVSLHLGFEKEYNAIHPHVRYQNERFIAGAYYNSIDQVSLYAGQEYKYNDIGLEVAAVSGYSKQDPQKLLPYFRVTYKDYFFVPDFIGDSGIVIGYELKH